MTPSGGSYSRDDLECDEAFMAAEAVLRSEFGEPPTEEAWCDVYGFIVNAVLEELDSHERLTHGRHCACASCERQDWTEPQLAPCGMHGSECPAVYAPLGRAGERVRRVA